tara:strand:- start:1923 stop:2174 length:252 start_codon:yes stop_codon:yes gene_type:complete
MKISLSELRKIIKEATTGQGVGDQAVRAFLLDELLVDNDELTLDDIIEQSEGAGFDSEVIEDTIEEMLSAGEIIDEDGVLVLP